MIEEAAEIELERVANAATAVLLSSVGELRVRTAGMRLTLKGADGNGLYMEITRDDFTTLLGYMVQVKCDG